MTSNFEGLRINKQMDSKGFTNRLYFLLTLLPLYFYLGLNTAKHLPDVNFDKANYHEFNMFQFMHPGFYNTWQPSWIFSYLNPVAGLPIYQLQKFPIIVTVIFGLSVIASIQYLLLQILDASSQNKIVNRHRILIVYLISLSPILISEIGTSFTEWVTTPFVLLATLYLIRGINHNYVRNMAISGFFFSLAGNLKLTNFAFLFGALFSIAIVRLARRELVVKFLAFFSLGAAAGFIPFLYWYRRVFIATGNPIFPLFNRVFRSEFYPIINFHDDRWSFKGASSLIDFFFRNWKNTLFEYAVRDYRWSLLAILTLSVLGILLFKRSSIRLSLRSNFSPLFIWFGFSLFFSLSIWFYARYLIPLEVVLGILIYLLFRGIFRSDRLIDLAMLIAIFLTFSTLQVPNLNLWQVNGPGSRNISVSQTGTDWGVNKRYIPATKSTVLMSTGHLSYLLPYFKSGSSFLNISETEFLKNKNSFKTTLRFGNPLYIIASGVFKPSLSNEDLVNFNKYLGLSLSISTCHKIETISEIVTICRIISD